MNRQEFLNKASHYISENRNTQYGEPEHNFERISLLWKVYLSERVEQEKNFTEVLPHDVGIMMALLKIARLMESPYNEDSWADAIGYLACGAELAMQEQEEPVPNLVELLKQFDAGWSMPFIRENYDDGEFEEYDSFGRD